jgi:hypothetical protein
LMAKCCCCWPEGCKCARHNLSYTRGWTQMVFLLHMIYSPETDRHSKVRFTITAAWNIADSCTFYTFDTYSLHKAGYVLCRARPLGFPVSWLFSLLHCPMPTVCFPPPLAGRVPCIPPHSIWPRFPQGTRTPPPHRPLQ